MLGLLPPDLLLEITAWLNFKNLTSLLLTGDRLLTIKLQHGGVHRLELELAYPGMGKAHYRPNTIRPKNVESYRSICFTALKALRTVIIEGFQTFSPNTSSLSVQAEALKMENIVELYLSTPDAHRVFIPAKYVSILYKKAFLSVPCLWKEVKKWESQNGTDLDLWLPISQILPSIKSLQVYGFIYHYREEDLHSTVLKHWANFQRLLPDSLTEFGCNIHRGDIKVLLDTLPTSLTSLKFEPTAQLLSSDAPSVFPLRHLRTIKNVTSNSYDLMPKESLTSVINTGFFQRLDLPFPPQLTQLSLRCSPRALPQGWEAALPKGMIILRVPDTVEVEFGRLPRSLLHLSCRATMMKDMIPKLPPRLISLVIGAVSPEMDTFSKIAKYLLALQHLSIIGSYVQGIRFQNGVDPSVISELPPAFTKLELVLSSIPNYFFGFTFDNLITLKLPGLSITETEYDLLFPSNIINLTCAKVKLQGLAASRDPSILHLNGQKILGAFLAFVETQHQKFGRTLFVDEFNRSKVIALSPTLQSISRKVELGELNHPKILPRSLTKLNSFCQVSLADYRLLPPSLTTYKFVCFKADAKTLDMLKDYVKEEEHIAFPQSLVPFLAKHLSLPYDDFCFAGDAIRALDESTSLESFFPSVTRLSLSMEKITVARRSFWKLPKLKTLKLVLYNDKAIEGNEHFFGGFPSLTSLSLRMDQYFVNKGFQALPRSLTSLTLSGRRFGGIQWKFRPSTLETLPPNLTSLVFEHSHMTEEALSNLRKGLTRLTIKLID